MRLNQPAATLSQPPSASNFTGSKIGTTQVICQSPAPVPSNPYVFDLGKSLQLLQSILLIATFTWALWERRRYRKGDRFSKLGLEFVAQILDTFYDDVRLQLEDVRKTLESAELTQALRVQTLSSFNARLFHVRTVVVHRLRCFSKVDLEAVDDSFSTLEDEFALQVEGLPIGTKHPESLAAVIGKRSAEIISILIRYEAELSGHLTLRDRLKRAFQMGRI